MLYLYTQKGTEEMETFDFQKEIGGTIIFTKTTKKAKKTVWKNVIKRHLL